MPKICVKNPIRAKWFLRFAISKITEDEWDEIFRLILNHSDAVDIINSIEWEINKKHEIVPVSEDLKKEARIRSRLELAHSVDDIIMNHLEFYSEEE